MEVFARLTQIIFSLFHVVAEVCAFLFACGRHHSLANEKHFYISRGINDNCWPRLRLAGPGSSGVRPFARCFETVRACAVEPARM